jgi:hypothetical protein
VENGERNEVKRDNGDKVDLGKRPEARLCEYGGEFGFAITITASGDRNDEDKTETRL